MKMLREYTQLRQYHHLPGGGMDILFILFNYKQMHIIIDTYNFDVLIIDVKLIQTNKKPTIYILG